MSAQRFDAPLVRHITERWGPASGSVWQRAPYVLLPGDGFTQHLWEGRERWQDLMPDAWQLPWESVVFDFERGRRTLAVIHASAVTGDDVAPEDLDRGRCWARVCTLEAFLADRREGAPYLAGMPDPLAPYRPSVRDWLAVEVWESGTLRPGQGAGLPPFPDLSLVPRDQRCWDWREARHLYTNVRCCQRTPGNPRALVNIATCLVDERDPRYLACLGSEMVMSTGVMLALWTLAYLHQTDDYLVEVAPTGAAPGPQGRPSRKPWTTPQPHYILLDPHRAREYGHPSGNGTGESAPRRAHGRRGHWRHLRDARYARNPDGSVRTVRVRPAWVGDREWESEGQRYRVVAPEGGARG